MFWGGLGAYALAASALCLLRLVLGDRLPPVLFATQLAHLWLAPVPLLALASWRFARPRLALGLALPAVLFIADVGPWLLPARGALPLDRRPIVSVLSWNLGYSNVDIEQVVSELRRFEADVLLLQEVSPEAYETLIRAIGDRYPSHHHDPHEQLLRSKAWFAVHAPTSAVFETAVPGTGGTSPRGELVFEFDGAPLHLSNNHASLGLATLGSAHWAADGFSALAEQYAARGSGVIAGDFNTTERTPLMQHFAASGLVDSHREASGGPGFSFPVAGRYRGMPFGPFVRIDYLWHTADLECVSIERGAPGGSDHIALLGVFRRVRGGSAAQVEVGRHTGVER